MEPVISRKIHYHDTDCGGVVYYANYLKYCEEARGEYLSVRGIELKDLIKEGYQFAVSKVEIRYHSPAFYADTIDVYADIVEMKNVSMLFKQEVRRGGTRLVSAKIEVVCTSPDMKLKKLPEVIRALPVSRARP